jgi:hypothetical protein
VGTHVQLHRSKAKGMPNEKIVENRLKTTKDHPKLPKVPNIYGNNVIFSHSNCLILQFIESFFIRFFTKNKGKA